MKQLLLAATALRGSLCRELSWLVPSLPHEIWVPAGTRVTVNSPRRCVIRSLPA